MGFPILSFTLRRSPVSVRALSEIVVLRTFTCSLDDEELLFDSDRLYALYSTDEFKVRAKNGFAKCKPSVFTVPL